MFSSINYLVLVSITAKGIFATSNQCKSTPQDLCWPLAKEWQQLNASVDGQLIASHPIAQSCYPGAFANAPECSLISSLWRSIPFQINSPIGYPQPFDLPCPPINASAGEVPRGTYHVAAGINFARLHNIRLVIRDTGHDFLGRSTGFGSLQIWIRYLRAGIVFHDKFVQPGSSWQGSAVTIGGGYEWKDVYDEAAKRKLIVVGGVSSTVGCIGGWMQGGGHGPPSHKYGLGSDQVLEARVVLANGSLVTTSPTQFPDLFFAIRGGGPSSYGVVVEATVKAWPTAPLVRQTLLMVAQTLQARSEFLSALKDIYAGVPLVAKNHWSGYGDWMASTAATFYSHSWINFDLGLQDAQAAFAPIADKLLARNNTQLFITVNYTSYATYADFYDATYHSEGATGDLIQVASRFLDVESLGPAQQGSLNTLEVHGAPFGAIRHDNSAANPAWRRAALVAQITNEKEASLKALAPNTGSYGNRLAEIKARSA
ncbi:hypothetical protein CDD81_2037 [Ophiocordyceps australis]|uniref:FAD-binding PCMH-type domain-containing protein n=1 Tax=Ophiocordyceps australis TaxID=1399860 RepID=A0A2C5YE85_9HYPO|nr:hypothetical protein CDD81_2037 [Ophiocordyceps australis]